MLYFNDNSDRAAEEISVSIHDNSNHDKSTHIFKNPPSQGIVVENSLVTPLDILCRKEPRKSLVKLVG